MKSVRLRLALWFGLSLTLAFATFVTITRQYLYDELHNRSWQRHYPNHPDWKLHGSYSAEEVDDILGELVEVSLLFGLPMAGVALIVGYFLARKSLRPIASVNQQLRMLKATNLKQGIQIAEADVEFRDLVAQINHLLARLDKSFNEMGEYAAKVAHEMRTPLAILRLKVEQAGGVVSPEIAEEFQEQLHHLSHVVDQSLLIAKAEQGRLRLNLVQFDFAALVQDITQDFALLAEDGDRAFVLRAEAASEVVADPKYVRQIIHSFFTNALKHGQGEIRVKVLSVRDRVVFTLSNWNRASAASPDATLGLGLRVVDSLLTLQPELQCLRRATRSCYSARLSLPAVSALARSAISVQTLAPALDPGI